MFSRRQFIGYTSAGAVAISASGTQHEARSQEADDKQKAASGLITSPPVVQNPRADGFGVSVALNGLATAWVEYGLSENDLKYKAVAADHGLVAADDLAIHVRVNHFEALPTDRPIYYRVVVQPLRYVNGYSLERGEPQSTPTYALRLPSSDANSIRIVSVNDVHENLETARALHREIEKLDADLLIINGDTCNNFDAPDSPEQILLNPAKDLSQCWAATRPMLYSNGNHDVRGARARELGKSFPGCPESKELPYNQALRFGSLALITLDTGEDKPDEHPVFAGTAAYEPYRERQAAWLKQVIEQPEIRDAKFKVVACHIPLRGLEGHNDGTTLDGYAYYSGFGAKLWLPTLAKAGVQAVLSGHMHRDRLDQATDSMPVLQFVGGGPRPSEATLTIVDAKGEGEAATLEIRIVDLEGKTLHQHQWA